jgi:hypothetical protein
LGIGPTTLSCKNNFITETATKESNTTAVRRGRNNKLPFLPASVIISYNFYPPP